MPAWWPPKPRPIALPWRPISAWTVATPSPCTATDSMPLAAAGAPGTPPCTPRPAAPPGPPIACGSILRRVPDHGERPTGRRQYWEQRHGGGHHGRCRWWQQGHGACSWRRPTPGLSWRHVRWPGGLGAGRRGDRAGRDGGVGRPGRGRPQWRRQPPAWAGGRTGAHHAYPCRRHHGWGHRLCPPRGVDDDARRAQLARGRLLAQSYGGGVGTMSPSRILRLWNPDLAAWEEVGDSRLTTHAAAADPHPGYVLESLLGAKGDLLAASAADTPGRLAVGTNGQVLTADSAQTLGVAWATPASGGLADPTTTKGDLLVRSGAVADLIPAATGLTQYTGDLNSYTIGHEFSTTAAVPVESLSWYRSGTGDTAPTALTIWDTTTSSAVVTITTGITDSGAVGWQTTPVPAPFTTVAGRHYRVTELHPVGSYGIVPGSISPGSGMSWHASASGGSFYVIGSTNTYPTLATSTKMTISVRVTTVAGVVNRLGVGTDGQVLAADSTQSLGVKWAAGPAGTYLPLTGGTLTGALTVTGAGLGVTNASGSPALAASATGDTFTRTQLSAGGVLSLGPGTAALDTTLQRTGVGLLRVDNHLGVGVTPAAWGSGQRALQLGGAAALYGNSAGEAVALLNNAYFDGTTFRTLLTGASSWVAQTAGTFQFSNAPSAAAGTAVTLTG